MIKVLIVDDQPAVLDAVQECLSLERDIEVVGIATDGRAALSLAQNRRPDIVLADIRMPGMDGIATTTALRVVSPESQVVILTLYDNPSRRAQALTAGAAAFVSKHDPPDMLLATIRLVAGAVK